MGSSFLFETGEFRGGSPEEQRKKPKKPTKKKPQQRVAVVGTVTVPPGGAPAGPLPIGRIDGTGRACYRCAGDCFDLLDERVFINPLTGHRIPEVLSDCVFCGAMLWIDVDDTIEKAIAPPPDAPVEYRFRGGRFDGKTVAEAHADSPKAVAFLAKNSPDPDARGACSEFLLSCQQQEDS